MRSPLRVVIHSVAVACLAVELCLGQQPVKKFTVRVRIDVGGGDDIKQEVSSDLKREFRSLGDVEELETDPYLRIRVLAVSLKETGSDRSVGLVLSVFVSRPLALNLLYPTAETAPLLKVAKDAEDVLGDFIRVGSPKNLQEMCRKVVADIDSEYIEPQRKMSHM